VAGPTKAFQPAESAWRVRRRPFSRLKARGGSDEGLSAG
jgi:hypothetical protein